MESVGRPQVTPLEQGGQLETRQMAASAGISWPRHRASTESVLVVTQGSLIVKFPDTERAAGTGDSVVIPPDVWHEVVADPEFTAIHVMPKDIRFTFQA